MPVIGYNVKTIEAERKKYPEGKFDVNTSQKIVSVETKDMDVLGKKPLSIEFEFQTSYDPAIGSVKLTGEVLYADDKERSILDEWKKNKALPQAVDMEVKNFLFRKCLSLGLSLSEEMQLPPPILFPAIVPKQEKKTGG